MKVVSAAVVCAVLAAGVFATSANAKEKFESVLATPLGITLQPLGPGQGIGLHGNASGGFLAAHKTAYGDERGMTLYTYAKDETGKSNCTGECTKSNPPALVPAYAKPFGVWTVIKRADGARQWARKGMPLYTFVGDTLNGSVGGTVAGGRANPRLPTAAVGEGGAAMSPDFKVAHYEPDAETPLPRGVGIDTIGDANGMGLVDGNGMTVYFFDGDANKDRAGCKAPCEFPWRPLVSPQVSFPVGDFTVIVRNDGINQWAYKGYPLYTHVDDRAPHYAKGMGADKRFKIALVTHHYTPPGIRMQETAGRGKVWANAQGLTLYRHDAVAYHTGGGHSLRRGVLLRPAVGRQIGTGRCNAQCQELWKPVIAPADAQPSGYWEVMTRDDGRKQWAYRGFAQFTYAGDKKPGDMTGNDTYDLAVSHDPNQVADVGTPQIGAPALYWLISEPH